MLIINICYMASLFFINIMALEKDISSLNKSLDEDNWVKICDTNDNKSLQHVEQFIQVLKNQPKATLFVKNNELYQEKVRLRNRISQSRESRAAATYILDLILKTTREKNDTSDILKSLKETSWFNKIYEKNRKIFDVLIKEIEDSNLINQIEKIKIDLINKKDRIGPMLIDQKFVMNSIIFWTDVNNIINSPSTPLDKSKALQVLIKSIKFEGADDLISNLEAKALCSPQQIVLFMKKFNPEQFSELQSENAYIMTTFEMILGIMKNHLINASKLEVKNK